METKIKNQNLLPAIEHLNALLNELISIGTKNRVQKIVKVLMPHYDDYHKLHLELLKKYGATEKDGQIFLAPPLPDDFMKEFTELKEQENSISFDTIDYTRIENIETTYNYDMELLSTFLDNYK